MKVAEIRLDSWRQIHEFARGGWLFRGQRCSDWLLQTSLERCCERERIKPKYRYSIEAELLREFKRAYHQYALHLPSSDSTIEWLSLMQHHGAPTRLLDFTYSLYVAAYFAAETADSDCAVWAVNGPWIMDRSIPCLLKKGKRGAKRLVGKTEEVHEKIYHSLLFHKPFVKIAFQLNPFRLTERIRSQRAAFVAPGSVSNTFMDNLLALDGHEIAANLIKIIIPARLRGDVVERLFEMNISRRSLFPGLDGYAQSLGVFHPSFRNDPHNPKWSPMQPL